MMVNDPGQMPFRPDSTVEELANFSSDHDGAFVLLNGVSDYGNVVTAVVVTDPREARLLTEYVESRATLRKGWTGHGDC